MIFLCDEGLEKVITVTGFENYFKKKIVPESNSVTEAECLLIKKRIISQIPFVHHKWNHICYIKLVVILYTLVTMKVIVNPVYVMTILLFCLKLLRRFSLAFSK